jgi:transcriptional regulator with GAF, ATPase, and Fis domain
VLAVQAWTVANGERAESLIAPLTTALAKAGIDACPLRGAAPGPCVLLFDVASPQVCELVAGTSCGGTVRVFAVAAAPEALEDGGGWRVLAAGAADVIAWDNHARCAEHVAARLERWSEVDELLRSAVPRHGLVGESAPWRSVLRQVVEVARFTDAPVLVTGESGTGKELVARLIDALDTRPGKPELVVVDCTTIVPTLSGSEFFGHERGSFTGATSTREGAFALADGGTLFLDEVGELPLPLQAELLRVVQEGTYKRVGSNTWRETHFRLVCATNRDLVDEAGHGRFRRDLYYRIAGWTFRLPPLRERSGDILRLIEHFLRELRPGEGTPALDDPVRAFLLAREYPGNVRDLRHLITRLSYRHVGTGPVTLGDLPEQERDAGLARDGRLTEELEEPLRRAMARGATLKEIGRGAADVAVRLALAEEGGNVQRAARRLGVTPRALQLRRANGDRMLPPYTASADGDGNGSPSAGN